MSEIETKTPATEPTPAQTEGVPVVPDGPSTTEAPAPAGATDRLTGAAASEPVVPASTTTATTEPMTPVQPVPAPESMSEPAPETPKRSFLDKLLGRNKPEATPPADVEQEISE